MRIAITLFLICTAILVSLVPASASDPVTESPAFNVLSTALISPIVTGQYVVRADFGDLPSGANGVVQLTLSNPNDVTFRITKIESSCTCTSAKLNSTTILPRSDVLLSVSIETPRTSRKLRQQVQLVLRTDDGEAKDILVVGNYNLQGLMCFMNEMHVQEVVDKRTIQSFFVPMLVTSPLSIKDLEPKLLPPTDGVVAKMHNADGNASVQVTFDPAFIPDEGLSTRVIVTSTDSLSKLQAETLVVFRQENDIEISPRTLRWKISGEEFNATCVLRIKPLPGKPAETVAVLASIGPVKLTVISTDLGNGIYRLSLSGSQKLLLKQLENNHDSHDKPTVSWQIVTNVQSHKLVSNCSFN